VQAAISLVLVGGIIWFVFGQFADLSSVWAAMRTLTGLEVIVLVAFAAWNLFTYWAVVRQATPGLTYPQAAVLTQTTTAVSNALPAGGAIGVGLTYSILGSWGFSRSRTTLSVLVSGIWNNFVKLATPVLALVFLAFSGSAGGGRVVSGFIGLGALAWLAVVSDTGSGSFVAAILGLVGLVAAIALFTMVLHSDDLAARIGIVTQGWASALLRVFRKPPATGWDHAVVRFRGRVIGLVSHRWLPLTFWTIVGHLSLYLVLVVSLREMGVSEEEVSAAQILVAFAFARLLTAIPLTPGGVGVIELALISAITSAGGDDAETVAAVLIYRLLTYVLPIVIGVVTYVVWRRNRSWRDSAPPLPAELAPA
jgi:putative heme transporter